MADQAYVEREMERHLREIAALFKPGLTFAFVVCARNSADHDVVMTNGDYDDLIMTIERAKARDAAARAAIRASPDVVGQVLDSFGPKRDRKG